MIWTDQEVVTLEGYLAEGLTRSAIAQKMGRTKNEICGKIHRLGLNGLPKRDHKSEHRRKRSRRPGRQLRPSDLIMIHRRCQYPIGDPKEPGFHYCGQKLDQCDGRPYCDEHAALCNKKGPEP